jgi:hypothetical protein
MSDYNYLIQCNFSDCLKAKSCERILSERDEINYKYICHSDNGFAMYVELKDMEVQQEDESVVEGEIEGCDVVVEGEEKEEVKVEE